MTTIGSADHQVNRFGLSDLFKPESGPTSVDIVFVHGLNGHPENTWTSEKSKTLWPRDLLPQILEDEKARILVYGYDADVTSFTDGVGRDKIHNHAEHLVAALAANRRIRKAAERPIIFVAHSLGGLVVKRALIYSSEIRGVKTDHLRSIFVSTHGILFLGTPHKGADLAKWGSRLERICDAVIPGRVLDTRRDLVDDLKTNNETLQNIDRQFIQIMSKFHIFFFHEGKPTKLGSKLEFIVDEDSASPTVQDVERAGIQADHSHMCKFENDNAPGFDLVVEGIQRYADQAPAIIVGRWEAEKRERGVRRDADITEISRLYPDTDSQKGSSQANSRDPSPSNSSIHLPHLPSHASALLPKPTVKDDAAITTGILAKSSEPLEPYFIVPPGFRPNTFFVGMEREMQELNRRLFDNRRRRDGTVCVLLHGQAGGGKSHLARQYVNKNRKKFNGGIFWIIANSNEERNQAFWIIHQKVVARESPELCVGDGVTYFVESVKSWFEARHEWLIVFDGVVVDKDADATELQQFVPDSKRSSIIYISRGKNLESKQRLLRPFPIRVAPLKEEDARKLLFKELHIKKPNDAEVKRATELVKKIGGLPLAINAISHRLADTHEPLTKYNIKSYSADPKMRGTYHKILEDLKRLHVEAWNLIHILCFFGQHIPVEMVHLGLRSLRTIPLEVKSREEGGKADIETTFSILIRYALIERNEPDEKDSMSSSRDSLVDPEPIDMLKIHSVVQKFCGDSLHADGRLREWLEYAVRLFRYSFNEADIKIKGKTEPVRVSDYRYYLVHGQRLWDHSNEYKNEAQPLNVVRRDLEPILATINEEIEKLQSSSSQESVNRGIFQISIFDRTSSSSESGPSIEEARTPDHRPPPLLPMEDLYGMIGKATNSPRSFGTASPGGPRIVDNNPSIMMPPYYQDDGYQSDNEGFHGSQPMRKTPSDMTARPHAPSVEAPGAEWQVVPPSRKPPKRRDLGSFRPTPPRPTPPKTQARLDTTTAVGSVARPRQNPGEPRFASLREVSHSSPPRSNNDGVPPWHRGASDHSTKQQIPQSTYAGVAKRQTQQINPRNSLQSSAGQSGPSSRSALMESVRSSDALGSRQGNAQPSSPASEFVKQQGDTGSRVVDSPPYTPTLANMNIDERNENLPGLRYTIQPSPSGLSDLARPRYVEETFNQNYSTPQIHGPNPAPVPLERDISINTTHHYPFQFQVPYHSPPYPTNPHLPHSQSPRSQPRTHYSPPPLPTGYYSQPMSRHGSRHSHNSAAETEPLHQHHQDSFSPHSQGAPFVFPRDHMGQPLRKSPKTTDYDFPGHELSGAGGWAYPTGVPGGSADAAMSRSSSGPGFAVAGAGEDGGLGIVRFDGAVQFGEHEPVSIEEARRRAMDYEQRLEQGRDVSRGRARRREPRRNDGQGPRSGSGSRPYPDVNLIPAYSDLIAAQVDGRI